MFCFLSGEDLMILSVMIVLTTDSFNYSVMIVLNTEITCIFRERQVCLSPYIYS